MTVEQGGDTDTNACIVGKMIGALVGMRGIPKKWLDKVLSFNCYTAGTQGKPGRNRSELKCGFLSVKKYAVKNIEALIATRPQTPEEFKII